MQEMLFRSTFCWRLRPRSVTREAALRHQGEHSGHIEKAGIRAYSALADQGKRTSLLTIEDFIYDAQRYVYTSPETRSCAVGAKTTGEDTQGRVREVRRGLFSLQRVSSQKQVSE